jgi:hypothetical protein
MCVAYCASSAEPSWSLPPTPGADWQLPACSSGIDAGFGSVKAYASCISAGIRDWQFSACSVKRLVAANASTAAGAGQGGLHSCNAEGGGAVLLW